MSATSQMSQPPPPMTGQGPTSPAFPLAARGPSSQSRESLVRAAPGLPCPRHTGGPPAQRGRHASDEPQRLAMYPGTTGAGPGWRPTARPHKDGGEESAPPLTPTGPWPGVAQRRADSLNRAGPGRLGLGWALGVAGRAGAGQRCCGTRKRAAVAVHAPAPPALPARCGGDQGIRIRHSPWGQVRERCVREREDRVR